MLAQSISVPMIYPFHLVMGWLIKLMLIIKSVMNIFRVFLMIVVNWFVFSGFGLFKIVVKFIYRFNRRDIEQVYIACLFFKFIDVVSGRLIAVWEAMRWLRMKKFRSILLVILSLLGCILSVPIQAQSSLASANLSPIHHIQHWSLQPTPSDDESRAEVICQILHRKRQQAMCLDWE